MKKGFTLMEIAVVVVILACLIGFTVPKFMTLMHKAQEGSTKHQLMRVRSAIAAYYGENQGRYPTDDLSCLVPQFIEQIPPAQVPGYAATSHVSTGSFEQAFTKTGGWAYVVTTNCPEEKSEAAWKFVKYLTSAYEDGEWAIITGAIPARSDALTDLTYDVNKGSVEKAIAITMDVLGYAQEDGAYMLTPSTLTYSIIREALYQVLTDGDVDAALATIQAGAETMLAENYSR